MRELKFRAWYENKMHYLKWSDICNCEPGNISAEGKIMQYIGLKDHDNKKEIYAGDIVEEYVGEHNGMPTTSSGSQFLIEWDSENACFKLPPHPQRMFIVGNIFTRPNLLKN